MGSADGMDRKVALVSGASRGIGRAVAIQLARDGYDIAFCFQKSEHEAAEVAALIRAEGRRVFPLACEVQDFEQVKAFVSAIEADFGPIHVLVNNAGITRDQPLMLMDRKDWHDVVSVNMNSVFNFCRAAIFALLKRRSGYIVNISSVAGVGGNPGQTNYSASKAGVIGFSQALAKEVGSRGITVNAVAPGFIDTDMTAGLPEKQLKAAVDLCSLRRRGNSQDVAHVVSFLASGNADFITGQVLCVDGGLLI